MIEYYNLTRAFKYSVDKLAHTAPAISLDPTLMEGVSGDTILRAGPRFNIRPYGNPLPEDHEPLDKLKPIDPELLARAASGLFAAPVPLPEVRPRG
jgi:hypothetical protein